MSDHKASERYSSLLKNETCNEYLSCPHCGSFFLSDTHCESCQKRRDYNPLGELLGPKSFYSLKEEYLEDLNFFESNFEFVEKKLFKTKKNRFIRKMILRHNDLIEYFSKKKEDFSLEDTIYRFELQSIIQDVFRLTPFHAKTILEGNFHNSLIKAQESSQEGPLTTFIEYHIREEEQKKKTYKIRNIFKNKIFWFTFFYTLTIFLLMLVGLP